MATLEENLRKIRGEAIYGRDIREAIAEGITQMDDQIANTITNYSRRLTTVENEVDDRDLFMNVTKISGDDYLLTITNPNPA